MFEIYAVNIKDIKDERMLDNFFQHMSAEKIQRMLKFKRYEDRKRGVIGELLIRYLVCGKLGINNNEINFIPNKYGKPFLKDYIGLEYNISHSNELVVCAVGDYEVGIDIEYVKDMDIDAANYVLSTDEKEEYKGISENEKLDYFYSIWTLKESFIKAKGMGLHISMNSFTVNRKLNEVPYCLYNNVKYHFKEYNIPEYKLSICSKLRTFPDNVQFYSGNEFLSLLQSILKEKVL